MRRLTFSYGNKSPMPCFRYHREMQSVDIGKVNQIHLINIIHRTDDFDINEYISWCGASKVLRRRGETDVMLCVASPHFL